MTNKQHLIFEYVTEVYTQNDVEAMVNDTIPDYVDSDWEDEYENELECYNEYGSNEAELNVIEQVMVAPAMKYCKIELTLDEFSEVVDAIAAYYNVNLGLESEGD